MMMLSPKSKQLQQFFIICLAAFLFLNLTACSSVLSTEEASKKYQSWSEAKLFAAGEKSLKNRDYKEAVDYFEAIKANYPFGQTAEKANRDLIYAYYQTDDYVSTAAAAEHFIHLYPRNEGVDYAYYMKGMANFNANRSFLQKLLPIALEQRDTTSMRDAYHDFMLLIQIFPDSPYASDARQHLVYLRNILAKQELDIARYYFQRAVYLGAANRAAYIVEHFEHAPQVKEALEIMVASYEKLGETQSAEDAKRVLDLNFS
jgi:outer membrane protein assembly factor BamD